jgi:hypothetical protein
MNRSIGLAAHSAGIPSVGGSIAASGRSDHQRSSGCSALVGAKATSDNAAMHVISVDKANRLDMALSLEN